MTAHAVFQANGPFGSETRKFRRPDPAPPGQEQLARFPLRRLAAISGVDVGTIQNWTGRRIWDRQTANNGKHRRFTFWDGVHIAIIREMATLGMTLSGRGAILSESLLAVAKCHVRWEGDLNLVPERIAMFCLDDEAEWQIEWQAAPDRLPRSYIVLNLKGIVEDVSNRYHAQSA